ncbi:hypothetical protein ABID95_008091 [Streptomyces atratus]
MDRFAIVGAHRCGALAQHAGKVPGGVEMAGVSPVQERHIPTR